jgi:hypothetical protein
LWLVEMGLRQQQFPFGDDNQRGKNNGQKQQQRQQRIPYGDDNRKGNGNSKRSSTSE